MSRKREQSSIKEVIKYKMRLLDDFGICDKHDKEMEAKIAKAINDHPDKDPREVADTYCRPMVQAVVNRWK